MRKAFVFLLVVLLSLAVFVSCDQDTEDNTFTVTFEGNAEGVTGQMTPQSVARYYTEKLAANTFTREGWIFNSWNTKSDGSGVSYVDEDSIRLAKDITLYAQWTYNKVKVSFKSNYGFMQIKEQEVTRKTETELEANTFTRENDFVFVNWNTKSDGSGDSYDDKSKVTLLYDLELYAQWYHDQVTVTFMPNGGTGESYKQTVYTNMPQKLESCSFIPPVDNTFMYWTTNADGTGDKVFDKGEININENLTLYAQWINAEIINHDTQFLFNDKTYTLIGDVVLDNRVMVFGAATIILPEGKTLTAPQGIYIMGAPGFTLTINGNGALIATADEGNAAIGGNSGQANGAITINGGVITATGSPTGGAGIGGGSGQEDEGTLTIGPGVTVTVSDDGETWEPYDGTHRKRYMKVQ